VSEHHYVVKLPGALALRIYVPEPYFTDETARMLAAAYLPGAEFLSCGAVLGEGELVGFTKLIVRFVEAPQAKLEVDSESGTYTLSGSLAGEATLMDLLFLCYGVVRLHWLKVGLYPVHGACLAPADRDGLRLIVGHSGVGKTALTLSCVARGEKVFSGNKTLVKIEDGVVTAVAGTLPITTRAEDAARHLDAASIKTGYQGRSAFYLADHCYAGSAPRAVKLVVLPRLNDGVEKSKKLSALSALHKLYPYFIDAVNADIVLSGGKVVLSGSPPGGAQAQLASSLAVALAGLSVCEIEGSLAFINRTLETLPIAPIPPILEDS
jgi:hypothetical protein